MLDERKTAILSAVVHEYIATAQPVGSTHIADAPASMCRRPPCATRWPCSNRRAIWFSRTRRPVGSRPTRATASSSTTSRTPGLLDQAPRKQVGDFFSAAHGRLEEMLHQTSNLLVAADQRRLARRRARRPRRSRSARSSSCRSRPRSATVVVVLANGSVENDDDRSRRRRRRRPCRGGIAHLSSSLGRRRRRPPRAAAPTGDAVVDALCASAALAALPLGGSRAIMCTSAGPRRWPGVRRRRRRAVGVADARAAVRRGPRS